VRQREGDEAMTDAGEGGGEGPEEVGLQKTDRTGFCRLA